MLKEMLTDLWSLNRFRIIIVIGITIVVFFGGSMLPILVGFFVDNISQGRPVTISQSIATLFAIAIAFVGQVVMDQQLTKVVVRMVRHRYLQTADLILRKERELFRLAQIGEIIDTFGRYIQGYEGAYQLLLSILFPTVVSTVILAAAIMAVGEGYSSLAILTIDAVIFLASLQVAKRSISPLREYGQTCYRLSNCWVELLVNNRLVQSENSFTIAQERLGHLVSQMTENLLLKNSRQSQATHFNQLGGMLASAATTLLMATAIHSNTLTIGKAVTIMTLNSLLFGGLRSLGDLSSQWKVFRSFHDDFAKLTICRTYTDHQQPISELMSPPLEIAPFNIHRDGKIILSLTEPLNIRHGEKILILGLSGSGKSTFLGLFNRAELDSIGHVSLNGLPAASIPSSQYQTLIRICHQENEVLSGSSFRDWFQCSANMDRCRQLLDTLGLPPDLVAEDRFIEPYCSNISGGEARRLSIIRTLLRPGSVNIFDEPTSGLNPSLAEKTWDTLLSYLTNSTVICATHDLSVVDRFDRILIIENGKIGADLAPHQLRENACYLRVKNQV